MVKMSQIKKITRNIENTVKYPFRAIRTRMLRIQIPLRKDTVPYVAHRGLSAKAPENTIPAFRLAAKYGFDSMETDIRRTKDHKLVLMHDESLKRMCGVDALVGNLTLEELSAIPVTGGNGQKVPASPEKMIRIPLFTDYLAICRDSGMVPMMELKDNWNVEEPLEEDYLEEIVGQVLRFMEKKPIIFVSFNLNSLLAMQKVLKKHGAEQAEIYHLVKKVKDLDLSWYVRQGIGLSIQGKANTLKDLHRVKEAGLKMVIWTVDDPDQARLYIREGVDWLASNRKLWK